MGYETKLIRKAPPHGKMRGNGENINLNEKAEMAGIRTVFPCCYGYSL
ncbi:hypothetical protein NVI2019_OHEONHNH_02990 [Providencia alcalifaciens]|nr:hypothetical protein NVI2019_OHEONHNH_02990 [Providencia alcalifaciens]CAG9432591.1 hypothetical protein NVI2019_PLFLNFOB_03485 [Providencia alcalifaciens]CAG9432744.1 hypothetical protein NVI2019_KOLGMIGM_03486 [Providencia alcalifaciens]CAG9433639.1 hypothetical protein NVI2019_OGMBKCAO_03486 [Providencia alcalifaciens]CAG9433866.1 hypothetical protein NVI2019_ANGEOOBF_03485 [Providencia alcalifaciens]